VLDGKKLARCQFHELPIYFLLLMMKINVDIQKVQEPITSASPEVREIIERVLKLEKEKLYQRRPRNINDDILKIVKETIQ
jgi:hypothetical protein